MKFQQLEIFCAVAREESISRAARSIHLAQPHVSRQIALLETELGTRLFIRGNKGVQLTPAGQSLYRESRMLMQGMEDMVSHIRNIEQGIMGSLKVGIVYSVIPYAMRYLTEFHRRYPLVELKVDIGTPAELAEQLRQGEQQAIFIRGGAGGQYGFRERILSEDPLELIMTKSLDPAPDLAEIPFEMLKDVPFCLLRDDDIWGYSNYISDECLKRGFRPHVVCQCQSTHIAAHMILAGMGISFLPRSIVDTLPDSGLFSKPVVGLRPISTSVLVWDERTSLSPCGKLFIELSRSMLTGEPSSIPGEPAPEI